MISNFSKGRNDIDHTLLSKCTSLVFNKKTKKVEEKGAEKNGGRQGLLKLWTL